MKLLQKQIEITLELAKLLDSYQRTLEYVLRIAQEGTHEEVWSELDAQTNALSDIAEVVKETLEGEPKNETFKFAHYLHSISKPCPTTEFYVSNGSRLSSDSDPSACGTGPASK